MAYPGPIRNQLRTLRERGRNHVAAVRRRLEQHGLRVICLRCEVLDRHWPRKHGRLRHRLCPSCRTPGTMRSVAWAEKHWAKYELERDRVRKLYGEIETVRSHGVEYP